MINFCHPVMKPAIDCSTVCTDGYEITNLITNDPNLQRKGFITYHAIRPPVTVTFNFISKVNMSEVILWSEVGSQKSTGFELYAASNGNFSTPCAGKNKSCSSSYEKVACAFINGFEKGVIFSSNNAVLSSHVDKSNFVKSTFFCGKRNLLNNISSLVIKIIKTASLPCLARVEAWGQPSSSSDDATRKNIVTLWECHARLSDNKINTGICRNDCNNDNANSLGEIEDGQFKIPEEFLDSITCKLMALPMTLPCGKIVDQSTLDKFEQYEATWGRLLSDPFTGKTFTEGCRPIVAMSLKARIDKFLIEHADVPEVKVAPRTVGGKISSAAATSSYHNISNFGCGTTEKERKRSGMFSEQHEANKKQRLGQSLSLNHEERLNRSLRSAVKNVLAGLPSFTKFEDMQIKAEECTSCHSQHVLYKLPCDHCVCRTCLVQKQTCTNMKCDVCNSSFQSQDPVRQHK